MHIAFLTPEYVWEHQPFGGLANYIRKVSLELTKRNIRVSVIVSSNRDLEWVDNGIHIYEIKKNDLTSFQKYLIKFIRKFRILREFEPLLNIYWAGDKFKKKVFEISKNLKIDLLQTSNYQAPAIKLLNKKFPLICRASSYTPLLMNLNGENIRLSNKLVNWLECKVVRQADYSFSPSNFLIDTFKNEEDITLNLLKTPPYNEIVSFNNSFYRDQLSEKKYLLFFGRMSKLKGVMIVAKSLPKILKKFPDLYFVFIGLDLKLPSKKLASEYIIEQNPDNQSRIIISGPLSKNMLFPVIQNSLAVVMPSLADNLPNACLETLQLGVPIVGTYNSSIDEVIKHKITGILCKKDNIAALENAIVTILQMSKKDRSKMKLNIETYINDIEIEDRVGQLINLYKRISVLD